MSGSQLASVAVIVLNWNNAGDTLECLRSLQASDSAVTRIVVDNGSTDGSAELIDESGLADVLLRQGSNLGYAGGNNAGLKFALDARYDYIGVLNNDTVVMPGTFAELVEGLEATASPAAVSPRITYYDEPSKAWFEGGILDRGWPRHLQESEIRERSDEIVVTALLTGCCVVAHRGVWAAVGLFDARYFLIFEDSDWSMRARRVGVGLLLAQHCEVRHKVSRSFQSGPMTLLGTFYYVRNGLRFELRHSRRHTPRFLFARVLAPTLRSWKNRTLMSQAAFAWLGMAAVFVGQAGRAPRFVESLASRVAARTTRTVVG